MAVAQQQHPIEAGVPCRWSNTAGVCVHDGLSCEICENYEPKRNGGSMPAVKIGA